MSTVRFFDSIPHIVRYGMHDDSGDRSWIWFWRCGVRFKIHADGQDFRDTTFYSRWKPLIRERQSGEQIMRDFLENQWNPLCDLVISTSMPTLQRLAPDGEYWASLSDYIHTPVYILRLVASEDRASVETKVEEGPAYPRFGAYGLEPVSRDTISLPKDLPTFRSNEIRVLDMDKDWRQRPAKVCLADGRVFSFLGCEQGTRYGGRDEPIVNYSLDDIRARLEKLQTEPREPEETQSVYGVVLDRSALGSDATSRDEESTEEAGGQEERIAGLLLPWVPK